jgi:hypothetical protein
MPVKGKLFLSYCSATIEFLPAEAKGPEMHLLDTDSAGPAIKPIPANGHALTPDLGHPSMDHLDALEAQSIYIFREAFARL